MYLNKKEVLFNNILLKMRLIKKISKVGTNSLMVVLDKIIVTTFKLKVGDEIVFDIIRKIKKRGKNATTKDKRK